MKFLATSALCAIAVVSAADSLADRMAALATALENADPAVPRSVIEAEFLNEEEEEDATQPIDMERYSRIMTETNMAERRKLAGDFGLCLDRLEGRIPEGASFLCDPLNSLPQICTLVCPAGFYSTGDVDVACADAMCQGNCAATTFEERSAHLVQKETTCTTSRYVACDTSSSGLCLEEVQEPCTETIFEEVTKTACNLTTVDFNANECWNSGCSGTCDKPGVFHYYSTSCADVCPPWRDPDMPNFKCSPCPEFSAPANAIASKTGPGTYKVECRPGFFGFLTTTAMCLAGGVYSPNQYEITCDQQCPAPAQPTKPNVVLTVLTSENGVAGSVSYECGPGFIGTAATSTCTGTLYGWTSFEEPDCDVAPSPSTSPSASVSASITPDPELQTATPTSTPAETATPTITATPSKSPRPPKVKGSRAPTPAPKLRSSVAPSVARTA